MQTQDGARGLGPDDEEAAVAPSSEASPAEVAPPGGTRRVPALVGAEDDGSPGPQQGVQAIDLAILAGLVVLLGFLWGRARGVLFWVDEGISWGISSHAFTSIPEILRQDGAPPLYYLLLNLWMAVFGSSEAATHILSLGFALACIPAGLWAGWSLYGRRAGWICATLMALNPFLAYFANETRMYTLVVLLALLASATFAHAFVFRRRRYLPAFALFMALLVYTHNWGLFYGLAAGLVALACALVAEQRGKVLRDVVLAFGGAALLYLPWVPILLDQLAHSGAPFARRPTLEVVRGDIMGLFGSAEAVSALVLGTVLGATVLLQRPWKRVGVSLVAVGLVPAVVVVMGWMISRQESVWVTRYLAVILGPIALVVAVGLARGGRVALACLVVYGFLTAPVAVKQLPTQKSNVALLTDYFSPRLRPGDLVITDFGRVPLLSYYLPDGLRFAEAPGLVVDDRRTNQRDATERLRAADQRQTLLPLVAELPVGGQVLVVCQVLERLAIDDTEFVELIFKRCNESEKLMAEAPGLRLIDSFEPESRLISVHVPVQGLLFVKEA